MTEPSATPEPTPSPPPVVESTPDPAPPRPTPGAVNPGPVVYKGAPLDSERGPGLGCFRFQLVVLVVLIVVTPLTVGRVPEIVSAILLFLTIALLLVSGQTIIFLLRLVSADRRGRRRPLAPRSPTVGQLEDAATDGPDETRASNVGEELPSDPSADPPADPPRSGPVRQ